MLVFSRAAETDMSTCMQVSVYSHGLFDTRLLLYEAINRGPVSISP